MPNKQTKRSKATRDIDTALGVPRESESKETTHINYSSLNNRPQHSLYLDYYCWCLVLLLLLLIFCLWLFSFFNFYYRTYTSFLIFASVVPFMGFCRSVLFPSRCYCCCCCCCFVSSRCFFRDRKIVQHNLFISSIESHECKIRIFKR